MPGPLVNQPSPSQPSTNQSQSGPGDGCKERKLVMQIVVTWSNGAKSRFEVEVPDGATPLKTNFNLPAHDTALHQRPDERWECLSVKTGGGLMGYCLPEEMVKLMAKGHPVEGLRWEEVQADRGLATALKYCPETDEEGWRQARNLRAANRDKFHFHGHGTEQEAIDCYQEFLRDFGEAEIG